MMKKQKIAVMVQDRSGKQLRRFHVEIDGDVVEYEVLYRGVREKRFE